MKKLPSNIKVFIAGSKELSEQRKIFRSVLMRQQTLHEQMIEARTFEDFKSELVDESGHQALYNKYIANEADVVAFVFDNKVGGITREEFDVAYESFKKSKHPHIFVYCKKGDSIVSNDIKELKSELNDLKQYYIEYEDNKDLERLFSENINSYIVRNRKRKESLFKGKLLIGIAILFAILFSLFVIRPEFISNFLKGTEDTFDINFTSPDLSFKELHGHVKCMYIQPYDATLENGEYVPTKVKEAYEGCEYPNLRDDFNEEGQLIGTVQENQWPADLDCWSKAKWSELNPSKTFTAQIKQVLHRYTTEHQHTITLSRDKDGYIQKIVYDCDSDDDYEKYYSCTPSTVEYFWEDGRLKKEIDGSNTTIYVYNSDGYLRSMDCESYGESNSMNRSTMYYSKYKFDKYGNWVQRLVTVEGQYGDAGDSDDTRYVPLEDDSQEKYIEVRKIEYYK